MKPIMIQQIYLCCGLMLLLSFLLLEQSFSKDLTLEDVVEAVNFSRRTIEDGELKVMFFRAPMPTNSSEDRVKLLKDDLALWERKHREAKEQKVKDEAKQKLDALKGRFEYLTKGRGVYETQNIVFQVREHTSAPQELGNLYRIHKIDQHEQYAGDLGAYNSYTRSINLPVQYHDTVILDGESTIYLWANETRTSAGKIDPAHESGVYIPFHLWGRSVYDIVLENVREFKKENLDGAILYTIEFEPVRNLSKIPGRAAFPSLEAVTHKIWVDSQRGFSVIRLEVRYYIKGKPIIVEFYQYGNFREYSGGIWYPGIVERTVYHPLDRRVKSSFSYSVEEVDLNIGIPSNFFENLIEDGMKMGILNRPQNMPGDTQED